MLGCISEYVLVMIYGRNINAHMVISMTPKVSQKKDLIPAHMLLDVVKEW